MQIEGSMIGQAQSLENLSTSQILSKSSELSILPRENAQTTNLMLPESGRMLIGNRGILGMMSQVITLMKDMMKLMSSLLGMNKSQDNGGLINPGIKEPGFGTQLIDMIENAAKDWGSSLLDQIANSMGGFFGGNLFENAFGSIGKAAGGLVKKGISKLGKIF